MTRALISQGSTEIGVANSAPFWTTNAAVTPNPVRWTLEEYDRLSASGLLEGKRAELIDGALVAKEQMNKPHAMLVSQVSELLIVSLDRQRFRVRCQLPLSVSEENEPEPDFALVPVDAEQEAARHPTTALWIIEVSDSTLVFDRTDKASLYALAQVPEYWVIDLQRQRIEVRRDPQQDDSERFGWGYSTVHILRSEDTTALCFDPSQVVRVSDFLP